MHNNRKLLAVNLLFIALEIMVLFLSSNEILALDYGYEGRINRYVLTFFILTQGLFLFFISRLKNQENQKRMYLGQFVVVACIAFWIVMQVEIHYKME